MRAVPSINRRALLSHSAAAVVTMASLAASSPARAADPGALSGPIEQLNAALLAAMKFGQNTPFSQRYAILTPAVERAFDLNACCGRRSGRDGTAYRETRRWPWRAPTCATRSC